MITSKKFGGKIYTYRSTAHSPGAAKQAAKEFRENGYLVRLVKREGERNGMGWWRCDIFIRRKK